MIGKEFFSHLDFGVSLQLQLQWLVITMAPEDFVLNFKPKEFAVFVVLAFLLIPLQTSFEEYLFRGHMLQGLGLATKTRWIPLVVTSFLFGIMHIANPEVEKLGLVIMFYYIGTGLFLGVLTLMDEGLELALGFHAANNLVGALLVTSDWSAFQTHSILKDVSEPNANIQIFIPILIIFPVLCYTFLRLNTNGAIGKKNFSER